MIYILIPTYNRKELLQQCINSFLNQTYKDIQIVVMDDGSSDGTKELLENYQCDTPRPTVCPSLEGISVIRLVGKGDWWWTGAMRAGVEYVLKKAKDDDFVLLMNDDAVVDKDYLEKMVEVWKKHTPAYRQPLSRGDSLRIKLSKKNKVVSPLERSRHEVARGVSIIGSICYSNREETEVVEAGRKINWKTDGGFATPLPLSKEYKNKEVIEVDTLSGKGNLVPVEVFRTVGNFSPLLPHYGADYEFFIRAKRAGYTLYLAYKAKVYNTHQDGGRNFSQKPDSWKKFWYTNFSLRSKGNVWVKLKYVWLVTPWPWKLFGWVKVLKEFGLTFFILTPLKWLKN